MTMLLKMAWRNIFRNRRRSLIVAATVAIGLWASVASIGIMEGMMISMVTNALDMHTSHINIHQHGFQDTHDMNLAMDTDSEAIDQISKLSGVQGVAPRILSSGLASSAESSSGIEIAGIDLVNESRITIIKDTIVEGSYLENPDRNEIVIGKLLAQKLGVSLKKKVVLMAQAHDGNIGSGAYRVVGLYETISPDFDRSMVYISLQNAQKLLAMKGQFHEIAVRLSSEEYMDTVQKNILNIFREPEYEVLNWKQIHPLLYMQIEMFSETQYLFFLVMVIAMSFTIINTLLMTIFERIHEFGVMKAMGVKSRQLVSLVIMESIYLAVIGIVMGTLMAVLHFAYLGRYGLDVSRFSDAVKSIAMSSVIYPAFNFRSLMICSAGIIIVAVLSSLYPGWKTARLKPVDAIHYR